MNPRFRAAASLLLLATLVVFLMPGRQAEVAAQDGDRIIQVPDGGRLDALDDQGRLVGPCPLKHTDVDVDISGHFSRVTLTQTYANPYRNKIEAVYTFPLSHRGAVDRMIMTVGDRVVVGEVKERGAARQLYEAARAQNYVASLLEQERPNIFTQSVANIEPGAEIDIEISYVEVLEPADGLYSFEFPMVVGPRYVPGAPTTSPSITPAELVERQGIVLLGPATLTPGAAGDVTGGTLQPGKLAELLGAARPIERPGDAWWGAGDATGGAGQPTLWYRFEATYCDGAGEIGELHTDGTGVINGRWFYTDPKGTQGMGPGYARDTNQVPDASRVTPMPVRPSTRAGHDVSLTATIDTGGPAITDVTAPLHRIDRRDDGPGRATIILASQSEIPNRDFVLRWRTDADAIEEAVLAHVDPAHGDGFVTLILDPPARVGDAEVPPRELIFVMDTSGSMRGYPIEQSKAVMVRAIDAMRPADTFNVITFAGHTAVLWDAPRPATAENRRAATAFVEGRRGGGGTEMMKAIEAALVQRDPDAPLSVEGLADLPADGRAVRVRIDLDGVIQWPPPNVRSTWHGPALQPRDGTAFAVTGLPAGADSMGHSVIVATGRWVTRHQRRILELDGFEFVGDGETSMPMRLAIFLTDGYVANDMAIIEAVKDNAATTRVFALAIGNSVNRFLIDGMARAGRGESEVVLLESDADKAVERLAKRIATPVLADIEVAFSDGLLVRDMIPAPGAIPDLFDTRPLVIHGRYEKPGRGTVTISGRTGSGPWSSTLEIELPAVAEDHDVLPPLWARARVESIMTEDYAAAQKGNFPQPLRDEVVALGEQYSIMTQFTSFVAIEKSRTTIDGKPALVAVPIELPQGVSWEGIFGEAVQTVTVERLGLTPELLEVIKSPAGARVDLFRRDQAQERVQEGVTDKLMYSANTATDYFTFETRGEVTSRGFYDMDVRGRLGGAAGMSFPWQQDRTAKVEILQMPSIFGDPADDDAFFDTSPDARVNQVSDIVTGFVEPGAWDVNGGDLVSITRAGNTLRIQPIQQSPEASAIAAQAGSFLAHLASTDPAAREATKDTPLAPPPNEQTIRRAINETVVDFRQTATTFTNAVDALRAATTYPIIVDDMIWSYATPETPVEVPGEASTLDQAVRHIQAGGVPLDLDVAVQDWAIRIVPNTAVQEVQTTELYGAADLLDAAGGPTDATVNRLLDLVTGMVDPDAWDVNGGGRASIRFFGTHVIVKAPAAIHGQVARLIAGVRGALGLPVESSPAPVDEAMQFHDVRDLVRAGEATGASAGEVVANLVDVIERLVDPDGWAGNGGNTGHIAGFGPALVVRTTPANHEAVVELLGKLREAMGLGEQGAGIDGLLRAQRLDRVLDKRLRPIADGRGFPERLVESYDGFSPEDTRWSDGGVLLSILVDRLDDAAIDELSALGVAMKARMDVGSFVVAACPIGRIDDVALIENVRWVEPARVSIGR